MRKLLIAFCLAAPSPAALTGCGGGGTTAPTVGPLSDEQKAEIARMDREVDQGEQANDAPPKAKKK